MAAPFASVSSPDPSASVRLGTVPVAPVRLTYEAQNPVRLPKAPAGIWRGQLGAALHRAASAQAAGLSVYEQFFRTPRTAVSVPERPARILGPIGLAGTHVPHPFVVRVNTPAHRAAPVHLEAGDTTTWTLGLIGRGVEHLPALTAVLDDLAAEGLGRRASRPNGQQRRGHLRLRRATLRLGPVSICLYDGTDWRLPADCGLGLHDRAEALLEPVPTQASDVPETVVVRFDTPVRLVHDGSLLDAPPALSAAALAQACYRRWAALALCYGADPPSTETLDAAFDRARTLGRTTQVTERALEPVERARYSARQERVLHRAGLRGTVRLGGPPARLSQWRRWLGRVAPLHLGKSTSMGFGHCTVDA